MEQIFGINDEVRSRFLDESLCRRCGVCCQSGLRVSERMILLSDLPCRFLSYLTDGRAMCQVYETREKTGWCYRVNVQSLQKSIFPPDCPYVHGLPHYGGKIKVSDSDFQGLLPVLREAFAGLRCPEFIKIKDWDHFIREVLGLKEGVK